MRTYDDLHDYQRRAIAHAFKMKQGYWFLDTGMGKTVLALAVHDQLKKRDLIRQSLVVAPKRVMDNVWRQEAKKWDFSKNFKFSRIHGDEYRGSAEFSRRHAFLDQPDIHLINYEGLVWLTEHMHKMKQFPWQCLYYDESTFMKRSTTKRFKAFKQFMRLPEYRFCLTGTPIPRGLDDIFGQAYCIDQGAALGRYITTFRKKYMVPLYSPAPNVTVYGEREGGRKEVAAKIANRVIRLDKREHLTLPPLKFHNIELELPEKLRDTYDEFEREFFLKFDGIEIEALNQVSADMKLRQFIQGFMYTSSGGTTYFHNLKLNALKKLELNGNTLIGYNFKPERDIIRTGTRTNLPFLDSRTTDKEAEKWIIEWNNYEHKLFLVNPASAAFGLNLQAGGSNVVWYGLTWNAEHYSQLIDRLWRQGQRNTVNVYHIIIKNTIDEVIANSLQRKDANQQELMNDIVRYKETKL